VSWISLAPELSSAGTHFDREVLSVVDGAGLVVDVVLTHVDRSGPVAAPMVFARLVGEVPEQLSESAVDEPPQGRCVRFPGQDRLTGAHSASSIVADTAIDEVVGIGTHVGPDAVVETFGFVRPNFQDGRLVLLVEPAVGGVFQPVEIEQPHECCGGQH
jgi:hypothetical protein